ncbi:hypothetical protein BU16DRAFT_568049 [Lophium mytilinum]|uniref:Uncharacterized protein n=1 Tax=Lophium mytilinum TaxID=390894 RepID=A0A6A6Q8H1_9PEZI|nr:hypothetical protein BU16DRAFT_568049 [Lophium mytilinum]
MKKILAGGFDDSQVFNTISGFVNYATDGHEDYMEFNKATNQHAWVAIIGKRSKGGKALYVFNSDLLNHPLETTDTKGNLRLKGRKDLLSHRQYQVHKALAKRRTYDVYIQSVGLPNDKCMNYAFGFIKEIMAGGDRIIKEKDPRVEGFLYITYA